MQVGDIGQQVGLRQSETTGRLLEIYLPYSDSITTRVSAFVPATANRLIPLFERIGRRGHARYLAAIDADEAAGH